MSWRVIRIGSWVVSSHLLVHGREAVLVDAGWGCSPRAVERALAGAGLERAALQAVLLTHGHFDHVTNLAALQRAWPGVPVGAHPEERAHLAGTVRYVGPARWCGRLERAGRLLWRAFAGYRPGRVDEALSDGASRRVGGGVLEVVHLPGHTRGHCGFWLPEGRVLVSGDLFASYGYSVHLPPAVLNVAPELFPETLARAAALGAVAMVPSHYDRPDLALHARRFGRLLARRAAWPRRARV